MVYLTLLLAAEVHTQALTFDQITIDDGLTNNAVHCIIEDSDGFMWFGSRDGLNRYDGYEFKLFNIEDKSISANNIQSLMCDEKGDLWVGLSKGGIAIFSRETQRFSVNPFPNQEYLDWPLLTITSIFKDSKENVWLGTLGSGILKIESNNENRVTHFALGAEDPEKALLNNTCFSFLEDGNGKIWMGTAGNAIQFYDYKTNKIGFLNGEEYGGLDMNSFRKSLLLENEILWIGTEGKGLFKYDIKLDSLVSVIGQQLLIRDVVVDRNGNILFCTDGSGLYLSTDSGQNFQEVNSTENTNTSLNTRALYDIYIDSRDNIWIGTFNGGINVHKPQKSHFYTFQQDYNLSNSIGNNSVLSLNSGPKGNIWIGTDGGGVTVIDKELKQIKKITKTSEGPSKICSDIITCQLTDSRDVIWMGSFSGGLISYDTKKEWFRCYNSQQNNNSISSNNVWALQEDHSGNLWIGTLGGGLNKLELETNTFTQYTPIDQDSTSLSDWNILCLLIDKKDRLWIGTEFGGLNLYDESTDKFIRYQFNPENKSGLRSNGIRCLFEDSSGTIWIGTEGGGLHRMLDVNNQFQNFSIENGLPSKVINAIEEDENQWIWISTNKGISVYDPAEDQFTNYYKEDGLLSNQFNYGASLKDETGTIYFGGINGITSFHPSKIKPNDLAPSMVIRDIKVLNHSLIHDDTIKNPAIDLPLNDEPTIHLKHTDNVFSIDYAALEYTFPKNQKYVYKLVGFDPDWKIVNADKRSISYTNLNHGSYTFIVKSVNTEDPENRLMKKVHIVIRPPYWKTWWFQSVASLMIGMMVIGIYGYQTHKRKRTYLAEMMKANQEILKLKNENLARTIEQKNSELSAALLESAHKNNSLSDIKKKLHDLQVGGKDFSDPDKRYIRSLIRKIDSEIESNDYWELFQLNFNSIHQQFSNKLYEEHPSLSTTELRLCSLIKLGMTNREISSIQNISLGAVEKSKYRIKKKIELPRDNDLNHYLITFN